MAYRRILLKVSGEALAGADATGFDAPTLAWISGEIAALAAEGIEVAVVVGAGNIVRGRSLQAEFTGLGVLPVTADQMGMLGTVINGLALRDSLTHEGADVELYATHGIPSIVAPYAVADARRALDAGCIVICVGGTGNPMFTTDSAACLRGIELGVDVVVKATQVDGVYDGDPHVDPNAKRYESLTFDEAIKKRLGVIDLTASALCRENGMSLIVCRFGNSGAFSRIVHGSSEGTIIHAN